MRRNGNSAAVTAWGPIASVFVYSSITLLQIMMGCAQDRRPGLAKVEANDGPESESLHSELLAEADWASACASGRLPYNALEKFRQGQDADRAQQYELACACYRAALNVLVERGFGQSTLARECRIELGRILQGQGHHAAALTLYLDNKPPEVGLTYPPLLSNEDATAVMGRRDEFRPVPHPFPQKMDALDARTVSQIGLLYADGGKAFEGASLCARSIAGYTTGNIISGPAKSDLSALAVLYDNLAQALTRAGAVDFGQIAISRAVMCCPAAPTLKDNERNRAAWERLRSELAITRAQLQARSGDWDGVASTVLDIADRRGWLSFHGEQRRDLILAELVEHGGDHARAAQLLERAIMALAGDSGATSQIHQSLTEELVTVSIRAKRYDQAEAALGKFIRETERQKLRTDPRSAGPLLRPWMARVRLHAAEGKNAEACQEAVLLVDSLFLLLRDQVPRADPTWLSATPPEVEDAYDIACSAVAAGVPEQYVRGVYSVHSHYKASTTSLTADILLRASALGSPNTRNTLSWYRRTVSDLGNLEFTLGEGGPYTRSSRIRDAFASVRGLLLQVTPDSGASGVGGILTGLPSDPGSVLIDYTIYRRYDADTARFEGRHYLVFSMVNRPKKVPELSAVSLGDVRSIDDGVQRLREAIHERRPTETAAELLYGMLLRPVQDRLVGVKNLWISPVGSLYALPFEILPSPRSTQLLGDTAVLTYVSGERRLPKRSQNGVPERRESHIEYYAAPNYNGTSQARQPPIAAVERQRLAASVTFPILFTDLDETLQSAEIIKRMALEKHVIVNIFSGDAAAKKTLKRRHMPFTELPPGFQVPPAMKSDDRRPPTVLHLATHGFFIDTGDRLPAETKESLFDPIFLSRSPSHSPESWLLSEPLARAGVALAGANRLYYGREAPQDEDSGMLTAYEVAALDLAGTDLVVLAACDTGLGSSSVGTGVVGLRQAFRIAGADKVIMSLWKVNEDATDRLFEHFYEHYLEGANAMVALNSAKKDLRADGYNHPYFWAGFILEKPFGAESRKPSTDRE